MILLKKLIQDDIFLILKRNYLPGLSTKSSYGLSELIRIKSKQCWLKIILKNKIK
jgi:hypothetical protein